MSNNNAMRNAQINPNDEYYTLYSDVAAEILRHKHYLNGKRVHCPFSDYRYSMVVRFLVDFFDILGLKHLTATCLDNGGGAWRFDYDGKVTTITRLSQGGSYDTPEVTEIMLKSDVVIDNPPFSKAGAIFHWIIVAPETRNNNLIIN